MASACPRRADRVPRRISAPQAAARAVLYAPDPRQSVESVGTGRDAVYAVDLRQCDRRVPCLHAPMRRRRWTRHGAEPAGGRDRRTSFRPTISDPKRFHLSGFLTPTTLYFDKGKGAPKADQVAAGALRCLALVTRRSSKRRRKDGTHIPYFVVRRQERDGPGADAALWLWRLRDFADARSTATGRAAVAAARRRLCGRQHPRRRRVRAGLARCGAEAEPAEGLRRFHRGRRRHDRAAA